MEKGKTNTKNGQGLKLGKVLLVIVVITVAVLCALLVVSMTEKTYKVAFDAGNGIDITEVTVDRNNKIVKPADPIKEGYAFEGWYVGDAKFDFNTEITEDITLTAKWTKIEETEEPQEVLKYTVTFDSNSGSTVKSQTVESGKVATEPTDPTRKGYTFKGWYLEDTKYDFGKKVTANITLIAKWTKVEENKDDKTETATKYTVKFDSNGGSKVSSKTVEKGKTVTKPSNPTRDGYTFKGWYLSGKAYNFSTKVTANITLTAKWEKVEEPVVETKKHTVTFETNGGSAVSSKTVEEGKTVAKPTDPIRDGYTFKGWYLGETAYNFSTKVTGNITLTAKWEKIEEPVVETKKYTVTFESNGGSAVSSKTVEEGKTVAKPTDPVRDGYTFKGWYLNGTKYTFTEKVTANITLTAEWKKDDVITWSKEAVSGGMFPQERIFIYKNGVPVDAVADFVDVTGKVITNKNVSASTGKMEAAGTIVDVINIRVK